MKQKYILYIFLILSIILVISLYVVEIPTPSKKITEEFKIEVQ